MAWTNLFVRASFNAIWGIPPLAITFLPSGHDIEFSIFWPERPSGYSRG